MASRLDANRGAGPHLAFRGRRHGPLDGV